MTAVEERRAAEIGQSRKRKEDQHLITGRTTWTDNMTLPGMVHLAILRSPMAHAKITSDRPVRGQEPPGVLAVFTGQDFAETQGNIPCAWPVTPDMVNPGAPSLAVTQVNHAGEAVAVIAARTKAEAQDALEGIDVEYEPLPPVLDMEEAVKDGAELVHPTTPTSNQLLHLGVRVRRGRHRRADRGGARQRRGDRQAALHPAAADPGVHGAALRRSCSRRSEGVTVWSATQIPHILRTMLALTLGIAEHKVRVIAPDVGGGFGGKIPVTPEEVITTLVARKLGKPAKYTESRSESLMSAHHGRDQIQDITITAKRDGTVTGLDVHLLADMGAYLRLVGPGVPILGAFMFPAIYKFPAYRFVCDGIFTTKTPTDAYRGAGRPEATYAIERIMDELAAELDMDPMELRRKNWIKHEEFPYTMVSTLTYDSGNYEAATDKALELIGWDELRREQAERRERKDPVQLGLGISTFTEMCGLAPSRVLGSLDYGAGGWENASIRMLATGKVEVVTGFEPARAGSRDGVRADRRRQARRRVGGRRDHPRRHAVLAQGPRHATVRVRSPSAASRSSRRPRRWSPRRRRSRRTCSRPTRTTSTSRTARSRSRAPPARRWRSARSRSPRSWRTTCPTASSRRSTPTRRTTRRTSPSRTARTSRAVEIDTETGFVKLRKYVCVDDVGTPINPLIIEGQVHGGLAQGIAQALFEEAVYDDAGNLTTGTFVDYTLPSASDLPSFTTDRTETRGDARTRSASRASARPARSRPRRP